MNLIDPKGRAISSKDRAVVIITIVNQKSFNPTASKRQLKIPITSRNPIAVRKKLKASFDELMKVLQKDDIIAKGGTGKIGQIT